MLGAGISWITVFLPLLIYNVSTVEIDWDLNGPCQVYIHKLARAQAQMTECAANFSSPPKVCTNCVDQYIKFKETEYLTHHLTNVTSLDNRTCVQILYDSYILSYVNEISTSLTERIWDSSRCESCLIINWEMEHQNSTIEYDKKTITFEKHLMAWRSCVSNYSVLRWASNETICNMCGKEFDQLFDYYWSIYKEPGIDFCLDIETTMNDTTNSKFLYSRTKHSISVWHNVWKCPDEKKDSKHYDITIVAFSASILAIVICLFYSGSYVQMENTQRNLVRYSRLQAPRGQRSRLLSSSMMDSDISYTPSSSQYG